MVQRLERQAGQSQELEQVRRQIIVIAGPEGSGKTTQANLLGEQFGLPRVAMGDVFRELATQDTELGRKSRKLFEEHSYSEIGLFREAFLWRMEREDVSNGFILDGGLRFTDEVTEFEGLLEEAGRQMPVIVGYLRVPIWGGFERSRARRRVDDTDEGIRLRQSHHYDHLGERMAIAQKKWPFFIVNAWGRSKDETHGEIMKKIEEVRRVEGKS